jgi:hypothetical protein
MLVFVQVVKTAGVETGGTADDTMHLVALLEE